MRRLTQQVLKRITFQALRAPTMSDGHDMGAFLGMYWQDNSTDPATVYVCASTTVGDASWISITTGGGGGGGVPAGLIAYGSTDGTSLVSDANISIDDGVGILLSDGYLLEIADGFGGRGGLGLDGDGNIALFSTGSRGSRQAVLAATVNTDTPQILITAPVVMSGSAGGLTLEDRSFSSHDWSLFAGASVLTWSSEGAGGTVLTLTQAGVLGVIDGGGLSSTGGLTLGSSTGTTLTGGLTADALVVTSGTITGLIEELPWVIQSPVADTVPVISYCIVPKVIDQVIIQTESGTCTASFQINGTPITGLDAISVSSVQQSLASGGLNTMNPGDLLTIVITSPSSPIDLSFTLQTTRQ